MKDKIIPNKSMFAVGVFLLLCFSGICASAYWTVTGKTVNMITTAAFRAEIEEQYEIPAYVNPGMAIDKTVNVVNTGTVDMFIRIKIEKKFGNRDLKGHFVSDDSLDPNLIEIAYNQSFWKYVDGYWYYTEVLEAGERTREPLFETYRISARAGNNYKDKDAEIIVSMESVQAEGNAISMWEVQKEDLGIFYEMKKKNETTGVTYEGQEKGFSFECDETDLFANFKNLLPGCARTQQITIKNSSDESIELFLHAEAIRQDQMTNQQRKLVDLLLSKYASITIKHDNKIIYEGPVNGNLDGSGQTLGEKICLGKYSAKERQNLTVTLSVSPEMEHDMQVLCGKVQWIFTAKGQEKEMLVSQNIPKTADTTPLFLVGTGVIGSMIVLMYEMKKRITQKNEW